MIIDSTFGPLHLQDHTWMLTDKRTGKVITGPGTDEAKHERIRRAGKKNVFRLSDEHGTTLATGHLWFVPLEEGIECVDQTTTLAPLVSWGVRHQAHSIDYEGHPEWGYHI